MLRSIGIPVVLALVASMSAPQARAFTAIVPDDYPGIQAAHDAGATVIQVRAGEWPGSIVITHDCTIEPAAPVVPGGWPPFPWIQGRLTIESAAPPTPVVLVRGLRIGGLVTSDAGIGAGSNTFLDCRLDSGIVLPGGTVAAVRHCLVTSGGIRSHGSWSADILGNTVVGGIEVTASEAGSRIEGNFVTGPAACGIRGRDTDGDVSVNHNVVRGATIGIDFYAGYASRTIEGNEVSGCTGDGIVAEFFAGTGTVLDNRVIGCGGRGIVATMDSPFPNPRVVVSGNVVGRSGGDGIVVAAPAAGLQLDRNTSYLNGGDGFDVAGDATATAARNLACLNSGYGLRSGGTGPALSCDDWYANALGATWGVAPDPSDLDVNPEFCGLADDDVRLASSSPLAGGPCAIVGAMGVGCAGVVGVIGAPPQPRRLTASPSPAAAAVSFAFPASGSAATLEVFDAAGALRRRGTVPAGVTTWPWDLRDRAGHAVPVGVYFARWTSGPERLATRVVIAR